MIIDTEESLGSGLEKQVTQLAGAFTSLYQLHSGKGSLAEVRS